MPEMTLLIPGPTPIPDPVRQALAGVAVAHRAAPFEALVRSCCDDLRACFRTRGAVLPITGSGSVAFESALLSLTNPAHPGAIVACHSGRFGERWGEFAQRLRTLIPALRVEHVEAPWGEPIEPEALTRALARTDDVRLVTCVHSETSTATASDLRALAAVVREHAPDALVIADCITSVCALPLEQDAWGVDVCIGASQKAFMLPPGLGFVSLGERAVARLGESPGCAPATLDLRRWMDAAMDGKAPFTPPTNLFFALRVALVLILAEGVEAMQRRTADLADATRASAIAAGLRIPSSRPSDSVTAIELPEGVGDNARALLHERHDIWLAGGQGQWAGRVARLGHMGAVRAPETLRALEAFYAILAELTQGAVDAPAGARILHERLAAGAPAP